MEKRRRRFDREFKIEAAELARLRRENKRLRMENEILKRTVGYFAKDEG